MNTTLEGSGALSPMDLSMPRSKGIAIGFWIVTALFCLQIGFTAYDITHDLVLLTAR